MNLAIILVNLINKFKNKFFYEDIRIFDQICTITLFML
jgi:hypothetical protein